MNAQTLVNDLFAYCEAHANEELVTKYQRYFKEGYEAYGLSAEDYNAKVAELKSDPSFNMQMALEAAELLVPSPKYEGVAFAYQLLMLFKKEFDRKVFDAVSHWFDIGVHNWAHTDVICGEIMPLFFKKKIITIKDLEPWRTAENKFKRRAVPVSLIKPFKDGLSLKDILTCINEQMMDNERVVHQGLGWLLRECWKKEPEPIEDFLHKWKNDAARLIFQYATEKMSKEYRVQFRKEK